MVVIAGLAAAAVLVAAVTAVRRPEARRLAFRSAMRRPAETALVVLGALLGTAIITGSLIVGDTLRSSLQAGAFTQLGPVDETVTAPRAESLPALRQALSGLDHLPEVDGVAFGLRSGGTAAARLDSDDAAVRPDVMLLELSFDEARGLSGDPALAGCEDVATPTTGEVAVSSDLAEELKVGVGDAVTVFAYGESHRFQVGAVLPRQGLAGYTTGQDAQSFTVFLAPGTLAELAAAAPQHLQASPPIAMAFVSNEGGVLAGADRTARVTELIRERIATVPQAQVTPDKRRLLDTAEKIGSEMSEMFLGIGAFAVVAGILLLVNVFVMLANERRRELGIMRAVGMRRADMVRAFFLEGSVYAGAAAVLGALAGIGVGAAIIQLARGLTAGAGLTLDLRFAAEPASIAAGLLTGLVISVLTILGTSVRISRLNIIRAIRELPEPPRADRPRRRLITGWTALLAGAAITAAAVDADAAAGLLLGPAIAAAGLVAIVGRTLGRRGTVTVTGLAVVAWGVSAPSLVPDAFRNADVGAFVVQGLVITGAAVVVLARNQDTVGRLVRSAVGGTGNLTARLGLAYPLARPFRTTMTLTMYALIIFTLVMVSLVAQVVGGQTDAFADAESGGYDLLVTSAATDPLPTEAVGDVRGIETVAPLRHAEFTVEFRAPGQEEFQRWFASGYDQRFLDTRPPALDQWSPEFEEETDVWEHVLDDPSTMIVGSQFLQEGGAAQPVDVGDVVDVRDPITGNNTSRTVVATMQGGLAFSGAFMSKDSIISALGPRVPTNRLYVAVADETEPRAVADTLEQEHIRHGVEARTFQAVVAERQQQNRQFMRILQGFLMLGLLVGIAGLAVVMVRAVRERRRQIGVLRSIGLQPETVGRAFMLEAGFIALQGIIVGTALGTATAYQLITNASAFGGLDVTFQVPWTELTVLLSITLLASVAAAGWPARRASRITPAVALQGTE